MIEFNVVEPPWLNALAVIEHDRRAIHQLTSRDQVPVDTKRMRSSEAKIGTGYIGGQRAAPDPDRPQMAQPRVVTAASRNKETFDRFDGS